MGRARRQTWTMIVKITMGVVFRYHEIGYLSLGERWCRTADNGSMSSYRNDLALRGGKGDGKGGTDGKPERSRIDGEPEG